MRLVVLTIAVFAGINCWALTFEGTISRTKTTFSFLNKSDNAKYKLTGNTPLMSTYITKLSDGDFVSVDGVRDVESSVITVSSINYVGLKRLIGTWFGDDDNCYSFFTNTDFAISPRKGKQCAPVDSNPYTYLLNPDSRSQGWVMLVSGDFGSYVGDLTLINPAVARLELYNSETGQILRGLILTRKK